MKFNNYEEIKENKEILDLVKHIKDIDAQYKNQNREKIEEILKELQKEFFIESKVFELKEAGGNLNNIFPIEQISLNNLYNKLPYYRNLCEAKLLEKCSKELYEKLKDKYNI